MNDDDDDDDDGANRWAGIEKERRKTNKFNGSVSKSNEKKNIILYDFTKKLFD